MWKNQTQKATKQQIKNHLKRLKVNNKLRMNNTNKSNHPFRFHKVYYKNMKYIHVNETIETLRKFHVRSTFIKICCWYLCYFALHAVG